MGLILSQLFLAECIASTLKVVIHPIDVVRELKENLDSSSIVLVLIRREVAVEAPFAINDYWWIRSVLVPGRQVAVLRTIVTVLVPYALVVVLRALSAVLVADRTRVVFAAVQAANEEIVRRTPEEQEFCRRTGSRHEQESYGEQSAHSNESNLLCTEVRNNVAPAH